jgi:HEAT repeat protein
MMSPSMDRRDSINAKEAAMARRTAGPWIIGLVALGAAIGAGIWLSSAPRRRPSPAPAAGVSSPGEVVQEVRRGSGQALALLQRRVAAAQGKAVADAEATGCVEMLAALRAGFPRFGPQGKAAAVTMAVAILDRFAVEPAPAGWIAALEPTHNLLALALADPDLQVRLAALGQIGHLWNWTPGRDLAFQVERKALGEWKEGLHGPVVRCLEHAEVPARLAATQCLSALVLDAAAAPALAGLKDDHPGVRGEVLKDFAGRPTLLTEEMIIPLLHDANPVVADLAAAVLKGRGLDQEQLGLCRLIAHPRPELRASAVPLLLERTDIDPVLWLIYLSRDGDATVRLKAVEALAGRITPESLPRLREMAAADPSPAVRKAAEKLLPADATVALPPLPGSPSLLPKAN